MAGKKKLEVEITGDSKGAIKAMGDVETKSGGLGSALTTLGTVGAAGIAAIGAAAVGAGAFLVELGAQFDDATDNIRIKTGATGAVLDELKGSFKAVLEDTPAEMNDVSTAITGINQALGLTGAPLEDLARTMLDLSRITGTDIATVVKSSTDLFNNWSVATEYQTAALDLLLRVSQQTGAPVESLSEALSENGVVLRELGFQLPEAAALFGLLEKAGMSAADVMPAFSKSMATAAKDGRTAADVLNETFAAIRDSPTSVAAAQKAMEVFGAKAGPKLAAMIREGKLSFEELQTSVMSSGDSISALAFETDDWGEKWLMFKNKLMIALEPAGTALFEGLSAAFEGLLPQIDRLTQWFADNPDAMKDFAANVQTAVQWIIDNVPGAVESIIGFVQDFMAGVKVIQDWWTEHGDKVKAVIGFIVGGIQWYQGAVLDGFEIVGTVIGWAVTAWNWLWEKVEQFVGWLQNTAMPAIKGFVNDVLGAFVSVRDLVVGVWDAIQWKIEQVVGFIQGVPGMVTTALSLAWEGLKNGFRDAINWIIDRWNNLSFTTPNIPGTDWGSQTISTPDIQRFGGGGKVRGNRGDPVMALVHAGETILPTHKMGLQSALAKVLPSFDLGGQVGGVNVYWDRRQLVDFEDGSSSWQVWTDRGWANEGPLRKKQEQEFAALRFLSAMQQRQTDAARSIGTMRPIGGNTPSASRAGTGGDIYISVNPITGSVLVSALAQHQRNGGQVPYVKVAR